MLWREDKTLVKLLSCVQLFTTPWTVAYQAPPSMGFSKWLRLRAYSTGDTASIPKGIEIGRTPITFTFWTILIKSFSASIKKKKRILEWVAIFFSRRSSRSRDQTWVFSIAGRLFAIWATREHPGSIPGSGRSPGEGNGNPLQYSCLENPMDGGAW